MIFSPYRGRGLILSPSTLLRLPAEQHGRIGAALKTLKGSADLSSQTPRVLDQGQRESCWAFSATTLKFISDGPGAILQSPWYFACCLYGTYRAAATPPGQPLPPLSDSGAALDDVVTCFSKWGSVPFQASITDTSDIPDNDGGPIPETTLAKVQSGIGDLFGGPYDIAPTNAGDLVAASLEAGIPVWDGMLVGEAFQNYVAGQILGPCDPNDPTAGGHATSIIGYKTVSGARQFLVRNSWGSSWGDNGNFWMSEECLVSAMSLLPFVETR